MQNLLPIYYAYIIYKLVPILFNYWELHKIWLLEIGKYLKHKKVFFAIQVMEGKSPKPKGQYNKDE